MDSEAVLQAIKANLASSSGRVSGKLSISQSDLVHDFCKKHPELQNCASCYQNIAKLLTHVSITKNYSTKIIILRYYLVCLVNP